ncbi:hypothetical protein ARSEF4850_008473 [Beauveria asiatica]
MPDNVKSQKVTIRDLGERARQIPSCTTEGESEQHDYLFSSSHLLNHATMAASHHAAGIGTDEVTASALYSADCEAWHTPSSIKAPLLQNCLFNSEEF